MKRFIEEARRMIRINSTSTHGNEEIANYVIGLMQDKGLKTQMQQVTHSSEDISKRQFNVIGVLGDPLVDRKIKKGLLLSTRLDTVSPGLAENWTESGGDPFSATIKDGKIFGLGAADAKLDFLCKLHAVEKFRERKLRQPIYLLGSCCGEVGMFGAKYLIKSQSLNPQYVIVGDPSELQIVYAHKCLNIFKVVIEYQQIERDSRGFNRRIDLHSYGKSAHGAYPHLGENAILSIVRFLQQSIEKGFEIQFTHLNGGDSMNKVPDQALVQFYLSSKDFDEFKKFFREKIRAEEKEKAFRVELGGVGDAGVKFLPDQLFPCLSNIVNFFEEVSKEIKTKEDETYNPSYSTTNFSRVRQKQNSIEIFFDIRLLPEISPDDLLNKIKNGINLIAKKYPNVNIAVERERINPSLNMSLEDDLVRICRESMIESGIEPLFSKKSTSTEAAQFFQSGYQSVVFGPGKSQGNSHSPNEYNFVEQLEKAILFYEKAIERLCL